MGQEREEALRRVKRDADVDTKRGKAQENLTGATVTASPPLRRPIDEQIADIRTIVLSIEEIRTLYFEEKERKEAENER